MTETYGLTLPLLAALTKLPGSIFWRQNSGTFRALHSERVIRATSITGIADIMGCYRGHALAIETKLARGVHLVSQQRFQAAWERAGGVYILARDIDETIEIVSKL